MATVLVPVTIKIAGPSHCNRECPYVYWLGQVPRCALFDRDLGQAPGDSPQRCRKCLTAEKRAKGGE